MFLLVFVACGELDFRVLSAFRPPILQYRVDDRYVVIAPRGESGFVWIGEASYRSPPMSFSTDGFRRPVSHPEGGVDWSGGVDIAEVGARKDDEIRVLATGSSIALGYAVEDEAVWTHRMEVLLRERGRPGSLVLNCAGPGWAPMKQLLRVEDELPRIDPSHVIVWVQVGDREFQFPKDDAERKAQVEVARRRQRMSGIDPFLRHAARRLANFSESCIRSVKSLREFAKQPLPDQEKRVAVRTRQALEFFERWEATWGSVVRLASARGATAVFLVYVPTSQPEEEAFLDRFRERFGATPGVEVWAFDWDALTRGTAREGARGKPAERKAHYAQVYQLTRDIHPNPRLHRKVAEFCVERLLSGSAGSPK